MMTDSTTAEVRRTYSERVATIESVRRGGPLNPTGWIADAIVVPAGYETIYFSGVMPTVGRDGPQPATTEAQSHEVFSKIGVLLRSQGLTERDVVSMTVYMATPDGAPMDFPGMMQAYMKFYGSDDQPNRPARTTVQVAKLGIPGAAIEVQVVAVRKAGRPA